VDKHDQLSPRELLKRTVLQCGAWVIFAGIILFLGMALSYKIYHAFSAMVSFIEGPLSDFVAAAWFKIGHLHIGVYAALWLSYAWVSCVWYKLNKIRAALIIAGTVWAAMFWWGAFVCFVTYAGYASAPEASYLIDFFMLTAFMKFLVVDVYLSVIFPVMSAASRGRE
jgi:hypothetical protein